MAKEYWDTIIVGQGLAGTTLAWALTVRGQKVLLIDAGEPVTSSKIAAGLITPITGMRMVLSEGIEHFLPTSKTFYQQIERRTGTRFFYVRTALRLFSSAGEQAQWSKRCELPNYQARILSPTPNPLLASNVADTSQGGFAMQGAQLDVAAFLETSKQFLTCRQHTIDWQKDVSISNDGVSVCGYHARQVVSCEGFAVTQNPYFAHVPFIAAKGEILTVRLRRPLQSQSLHRGIWLAPTSNPNVFRLGSSYDWETLNNIPTETARATIEDKLKTFFHVPYDVIDHKAAVRPIINQSKARIGFHPEQDRLGFFNGLGSKGSLHAPWYAEQFAEHIVGNAPLDKTIDIREHV